MITRSPDTKPRHSVSRSAITMTAIRARHTWNVMVSITKPPVSFFLIDGWRWKWNRPGRTIRTSSDILMHIPCCTRYIDFCTQFLFSYPQHKFANTLAAPCQRAVSLGVPNTFSLLTNNTLTTASWGTINLQPKCLNIRLIYVYCMTHHYMTPKKHEYIYCGTFSKKCIHLFQLQSRFTMGTTCTIEVSNTFRNLSKTQDKSERNIIILSSPVQICTDIHGKNIDSLEQSSYWEANSHSLTQ